MSSPVVSVITPAFRAAAFIGDAIESVLAQTEARWEMIVVDDASPDETISVVESYCRRDPRVRLLTSDRNAGPSRSRNRGIEIARGEWIALLDADDRLHPQRLERLLGTAAEHGAQLIADNLQMVDFATGKPRGTILPLDKFAAPAMVLTPAMFVRESCFLDEGLKLGYLKPLLQREFLNTHAIRYREDIRIAEDYHLYLDCLLKGARFLVLREPLYDYRLVASSLSKGLGLEDLHVLLHHNTEQIANPALSVDRDLREALHVRQRSIDNNIAFMHFVDRIKRGRFGQALAVYWNNRQITPYLWKYGCEAVVKRLPGD